MIKRWIVLLGLVSISVLHGQDACDKTKELIGKGRDAMMENDLVKSGELLLLAKDESEKCSDPQWEAKALQAMGKLNLQLEFKEKALDYFEQALNSEYANEDLSFKANLYNEKGSALMDLNADLSREAVNQSIDLYKEIGDTLQIIYPLNTIALLQIFKFNDIPSAISTLKELNQINDVAKNQMMAIASKGLLATCYYNLEDFENAKVYFEECLEESIEQDNIAYQTNCNYHLATIYD